MFSETVFANVRKGSPAASELLLVLLLVLLVGSVGLVFVVFSARLALLELSRPLFFCLLDLLPCKYETKSLSVPKLQYTLPCLLAYSLSSNTELITAVTR